MAGKKTLSAQDKELQRLRRRRTYIVGRLPTLKEELNSLRSERKTFKSKEQALGDPKSADAKTLRRRRRFVTTRIETLRKEKESLVAERKGMKDKRLRRMRDWGGAHRAPSCLPRPGARERVINPAVTASITKTNEKTPDSLAFPTPSTIFVNRSGVVRDKSWRRPAREGQQFLAKHRCHD
jgi:hypothetical protein